MQNPWGCWRRSEGPITYSLRWGAPERLFCASANGHGHLSRGQALLHDAVRLDYLVEAEHPGGLGLVVPGLGLGDHFRQWDVGQREAVGAEHEGAAVEAELDAGGQVGDRVEVGHRLQAAEEAELAHPATGPHDLQRVAQHAVANKVEDTVDLGTE